MLQQLIKGFSEPAKDPAGSNAKDAALAAPWKLKWRTDGRVKELIRIAEKTISSLIRDSDAGVLIFDGYGSDWIKANAKVSPDAYVQFVMQLAFYRMHGKWCATYETASTRQFKHGQLSLRTFIDLM